jgi:hypothetical protein
LKRWARRFPFDAGPPREDNIHERGESVLDRPARSEIEKEAEDHIALGMLLRKDRDERKKTAVERVLASDLAVSEKIEKIREIDEKEDALALLHIVQQVGNQIPRGRVSRAIKRPLARLSHLGFLFREYARVQEFGRKSHVLGAHLFPPGVRMDPHLAGVLAREMQPSAVELSALLRPVMEHGWMYLTARQYNLVALLKRLADRLQGFNFLRLNWGDVNLVDGMRRIENLFLMLHANPDTSDSILEALHVFFEKQHEKKEEIVRTGSLVLEILAEDFALPSLYNCIVGLNVMKYRRMLTLGELIREGVGDIVDSRTFDCENQIRSRMDAYVEDALQSMKKQHEQLQEARRINSFAGVDELGKPDTAALRQLYASAQPATPADFEGDQENLVLFLSRLLRGFDKVFFPLLGGSCTLEGGEKVTLFSQSFFEMDFARLRTVADKLETGPFHFASFPLSRYLQIKTARLGTVGKETEGSELILEGVGCLVDIGKTLVKVMSGRSSGSGGPAGPIAALQPIVLQGKTFSLPAENGKLRTHSFLNGKTVTEALSTAISVCFTMGLLFQDDFLALFLGKEKKLAADLQVRLRLIENLIEPESFQSLSALYT